MQLYVWLTLIVLAIAGPNDTSSSLEKLYSESCGTLGRNVTYDYVVVGGGAVGTFNDWLFQLSAVAF